MSRLKLIFLVCISVGSIIFLLFCINKSNYDYRFLILRDDFTALSSFIKKSLSITGGSLSFYTINNVSQRKQEVITRNVPSIVSVDSPYTRYAGIIN
jgi:hypothetical protein